MGRFFTSETSPQNPGSWISGRKSRKRKIFSWWKRLGLEIMWEMTGWVDEGKVADTVYLDFSKVFNTVSQNTGKPENVG